MKHHKIQVITKIDLKPEGNLFDDHAWRIKKGLYGEDPTEKGFVYVKRKVFQLGEILIVNECGREVGGHMRKADKWYVEYKEFELSEMDKAIKLSEKIMRKYIKSLYSPSNHDTK